MAVRLLPARDEGLARFDRWVAERLAEHAATAEDFQVLTQLATWRLRADPAARAEHRVLSEGQLSNAAQRLRVAGSLLAWLTGRGSSMYSEGGDGPTSSSVILYNEAIAGVSMAAIAALKLAFRAVITRFR
ncbi:MAG TPA: hypothetical protein VGW38_24550 [Chloroflexota bacterium]|nr:hypothetical protein [Chloroflexota bacterium]